MRFVSVTKLDRRHKLSLRRRWIAKYHITEWHKCSACGVTFRLIYSTLEELNNATRDIFLPKLKKELYKTNPFLERLLKRNGR